MPCALSIAVLAPRQDAQGSFQAKSTLLREKTGKNRRFRFQKTKGTPPCPFLPVRPVPLKSVPDTHSKANE